MDENELSSLEAEALIRETENEIFRDANGLDHPSDSPFSDDIVADQSRVEDWQGHVNDLELIETTCYGHDAPGFSRPLQYREEMDAVAENARLQQELQQRDAHIQQLLDQTGPVREALERQQQERRDALLNAATDPAQADQILGTLQGQQAQIHANNMARADASLEAARRTYGDDFWRVYNAVQAAARTRSPASQQILQTIFSSDDPGATLMSLYDGDLVRQHEARNQNAPFMPRTRSTAPAAQSRRVEEDDFGYEFDTGGAGEALEADIFRHAARR